MTLMGGFERAMPQTSKNDFFGYSLTFLVASLLPLARQAKMLALMT